MSASEEDSELFGSFPEDLSVFDTAELLELTIDVCESDNASYLQKLCNFAAAEFPDFDLNRQDSSGFAPLSYAVTFNSPECCKVLLAAKANAGLTAKDGSTSLHVAAQNGLAHFVEPLMKAKAHLGQELPNGARPLDIALVQKHNNVVVALVQAKCEVNYFKSKNDGNWSGQNPLRIAAGLLDIKNFRALLEAGADPLLTSSDVPTTLTQDLINRKLYKFLDIVNANHLKSKSSKVGNVWNGMEAGYPAFFNALYQSDTDALEYFVEAGVDLSLTDSAGSSALFIAAFEKNLAAMRVILDQTGYRTKNIDGTSNDQSNSGWESFGNYAMSDGFTAVHLAVENNDLDVLKCLCEYSQYALDVALQNLAVDDLEVVPPAVNLNQSTLDRKATPLHFAAQKPDPRFCQVLVDAKADLEITLNGGFTPLHLACQDALNDTIEMLLSRDADPLALSDENFTPLQLAVQYGDSKSVQLVVDIVRLDLKSAQTEDVADAEIEETLSRVKSSMVIAAQAQHFDIFKCLWDVCEEFADKEKLQMAARNLVAYIKNSSSTENLRRSPKVLKKFTNVLFAVQGSNIDTMEKLKLQAALSFQRGMDEGMRNIAITRLQAAVRRWKLRKRLDNIEKEAILQKNAVVSLENEQSGHSSQKETSLKRKKSLAKASAASDIVLKQAQKHQAANDQNAVAIGPKAKTRLSGTAGERQGHSVGHDTSMPSSSTEIVSEITRIEAEKAEWERTKAELELKKIADAARITAFKTSKSVSEHKKAGKKANEAELDAQKAEADANQRELEYKQFKDARFEAEQSRLKEICDNLCDVVQVLICYHVFCALLMLMTYEV